MVQFCEKYGSYVQKVHFRCHLHPNEETSLGDVEPTEKWHTEEDDDDDPTAEHLPQHFQDLLAGRALPNMQSLQITFLPEGQFTPEGDWDPNDHGNGWIEVHSDRESQDTVSELEANYTWRATINDVFASMSDNVSIRTLELCDLMPRLCSVWWSTKWRRFLNRLEDVKIELWGEHGTEYECSLLDGWKNAAFADF